MLPTNSVSLALHQEQADEDRDGDGNDHWCQGGSVDLQTFDGAEHRDRRGDHAIAIEQRGPDQADDEQGGARASARCVPCIQQREQSHDAALAMIVGAQDQNGVFESDDEKKRQKISDTVPVTDSGVGAPPASTACFSPYSVLVPISP